jgi:hypothetical protein
MTTARLQLPQADRLSLMVALLEAVSRGVEGIVPFSQALSVTTRQVHYYAHAASFLGLIEGEEGKFSLTKNGRQVLDFDPDRRFEAIVGLALAHPNLAELLLPLSDEAEIDTKIIAKAIEGSGYGLATAERRAQTIVGWFRQAGLDLSQSLRAGCPVRDQLSIFDATMLAAKEEERPEEAKAQRPQEPAASFENITLPSPEKTSEVALPVVALPVEPPPKKKAQKTKRAKIEEPLPAEEKQEKVVVLEPTQNLQITEVNGVSPTLEKQEEAQTLSPTPQPEDLPLVVIEITPEALPVIVIEATLEPVVIELSPEIQAEPIQVEASISLPDTTMPQEEALEIIAEPESKPEEPIVSLLTIVKEPARPAPVRQLTLVPPATKMAQSTEAPKATTSTAEVTSIARGEPSARKAEPEKQPEPPPEPPPKQAESKPVAKENEISSLRAVLEHLEDEDDVFGLRASQDARHRSHRKGPVFVGVALRASLEPGRATIVCRLGLGSKPAAVFREVSTTKQIVQSLLEDGVSVIAVAAPLWLPGEGLSLSGNASQAGNLSQAGGIDDEFAALEKEDPDLWVARPWTRSPFVGALGFARVELEGSSPGLAARGRCLREALAHHHIFPRMTPATQDDPGARIIEVHPGLTLAALANAASKDAEKLPPGRRLRRAVEEEAGPVDIPLDADARHRDALAAAWTALKFSKGAAWSPEGSSLQAGFVVVPFLG